MTIWARYDDAVSVINTVTVKLRISA